MSNYDADSAAVSAAGQQMAGLTADAIGGAADIGGGIAGDTGNFIDETLNPQQSDPEPEW
jgi:hypothetical protein